MAAGPVRGSAHEDVQEAFTRSVHYRLMPPSRCFLILIPALLGGCATANPPPSQASTLPTGAHLSPAGFLDIGEVPSSPYPAQPPPPPATLDTFARRTATGSGADRALAWREANGSEAFQAEVQRLLQLLPKREADNFVQLRLVRDQAARADPAPLIGAEVWFKRNAAATLARYTRDPMFIPRQGGLTEAEMDALRQLWIRRLEGTVSAWSLSGDPTLGTVELDIGVTEERFRALAARNGWTWGEEARFTFAPAQPPAFADPSLARLVRAFAREESQATIQLTALSTGRIVLEDGCFRLAARDDGRPGAGPLVMFGYNSVLDRDAEGYLAVRSGEEAYRIGEIGAWGGPNAVDEGAPDLRRLRERCGGGEVLNVRSPQSLRLFALPFADWLTDYALANRLSYQAAWDAVIACYRRQEERGRTGLEQRDACITQFNKPGGGPPRPTPGG